MFCRASQVTQWWRIHLPRQETQEMQILSLGQKDALEGDMATHSSCLGNSMDRVAWWATVHGVAKSWTPLRWLSMHAHEHTHTHTHIYIYIYIFLRSVPCAEKPGGLQSMGSQSVETWLSNWAWERFFAIILPSMFIFCLIVTLKWMAKHWFLRHPWFDAYCKCSNLTASIFLFSILNPKCIMK